MAENRVEIFTKHMSELLAMDREAELEENAEVLAKYSFKVRKLFYLTLFCCVGIGKAK